MVTILKLLVLVLVIAVTYRPLLVSLQQYAMGQAHVPDFQFMIYFDDKFNFLSDVHLNYLHPWTWDHLIAIVKRPGINVWEPVWNVLRAMITECVGNHPGRLRVVSLVFHVVNVILLYQYITLVNHSSKFSVTSWSTGIVCIFFAIHPLNVEVIGWVSAINYTLALFFSLLSSILLEIRCRPTPSSLPYHRKISLESLVVVFYIAACLVKAPAVMLGAVHIIRCIQYHNSTPQLTALSSLRLVTLIFLSMVGIVYLVLLANSSDSLTALGHTTSLPTKVLRASLCIWSFLSRAIAPLDLRAHYSVGELGETYPIERMFNRHFSVASNAQDSIGGDHMVSNYYADTVSSPSRLVFAVLILAVISLVAGSSILLAFTNRPQKVTTTVPVISWSWFGYLLFWLPVCGMVNHGWTCLGAERYNYFPLAYAAPGVAKLLTCFYFQYSPLEAHAIASDMQTAGQSSWKRLLQNLLLSTAVISYLAFLSMESTSLLQSFRNDKTLLLRCIQMDPTDSDCHEFLGNYYGSQENDDVRGQYHLNLAMSYLPPNSKDPKLFLLKAKTLMALNKRTEACDIIMDMYTSVNQEQERNRELNECFIKSTCNNWNDPDHPDHPDHGSSDRRKPVFPMIANNYVLCSVIKHGINAQLVKEYTSILQQAQRIMLFQKNTPSYIIDGINAHLETTETWSPGANYAASFLW